MVDWQNESVVAYASTVSNSICPKTHTVPERPINLLVNYSTNYLRALTAVTTDRKKLPRNVLSLSKSDVSIDRDAQEAKKEFLLDVANKYERERRACGGRFTLIGYDLTTRLKSPYLIAAKDGHVTSSVLCYSCTNAVKATFDVCAGAACRGNPTMGNSATSDRPSDAAR